MKQEKAVMVTLIEHISDFKKGIKVWILGYGIGIIINAEYDNYDFRVKVKLDKEFKDDDFHIYLGGHREYFYPFGNIDDKIYDASKVTKETKKIMIEYDI